VEQSSSDKLTERDKFTAADNERFILVIGWSRKLVRRIPQGYSGLSIHASWEQPQIAQRTSPYVLKEGLPLHELTQTLSSIQDCQQRFSARLPNRSNGLGRDWLGRDHHRYVSRSLAAIQTDSYHPHFHLDSTSGLIQRFIT
jgi:hypothetical protein